MPEITSKNRVIISDTSCLIGLTNIGFLEVLKQMYDTVTVTPEVAAEYGEPLPEWITVTAARDTQKTAAFNQYIDLGESSAIALAVETKNALLIIDDLDARQFAVNLGLEVTGTLGVLVQAHERGIISHYQEVIAKLREIGFRLPANAEQLIR
jgi:predicted nucleic acid-binding protein